MLVSKRDISMLERRRCDLLTRRAVPKATAGDYCYLRLLLHAPEGPGPTSNQRGVDSMLFVILEANFEKNLQVCCW